MTPKVHKKIGIEAGLKYLRNAFPNENLAYFLLGNWFTDVSQGVAPVDYAASMTMAPMNFPRRPNSAGDLFSALSSSSKSGNSSRISAWSPDRALRQV